MKTKHKLVIELTFDEEVSDARVKKRIKDVLLNKLSILIKRGWSDDYELYPTTVKIKEFIGG